MTPHLQLNLEDHTISKPGWTQPPRASTQLRTASQSTRPRTSQPNGSNETKHSRKSKRGPQPAIEPGRPHHPQAGVDPAPLCLHPLAHPLPSSQLRTPRIYNPHTLHAGHVQRAGAPSPGPKRPPCCVRWGDGVLAASTASRRELNVSHVYAMGGELLQGKQLDITVIRGVVRSFIDIDMYMSLSKLRSSSINPRHQCA
jgi:hypothetical protein